MTYVDLIKADLKCTRIFVEGTDEADLNIAAYHCQQAVEKICGYICQTKGITAPRTHNMEKWIEFLKEKNIEVPTLIERQSEEISDWHNRSRYNINFVVSKKEIMEVADATEKWLLKIIPLQTPKKCFVKL